jgi:hypothetical protein
VLIDNHPAEIKPNNKEKMMKRSVAARSLAALVLSMVIFLITPALGENTFPIPAIKIPNSSILPNEKVQPVPEFIGQPAVANPITTRAIPQNPYTAPDPWCTIHNDSYMSDTYPGLGPLGKSPEVFSTALGTKADPTAIVVVMTFDSHDTENHLIAASIKKVEAEQTAWVQLTLINPVTLGTLAKFALPKETGVGTGFRPAGSYFFLDKDKRVVIGTKDRTVWVVSHSKDAGGNWSFSHDPKDTYDLTAAIPDGDSIEALQPDWSGRIWFTSKGGVVGTVDMDTGDVKYTWKLRNQGERIVNGHAADEAGGVFIVSTLAMYRFDADTQGNPIITWREPYDAGTHVKEGQTDIGSGTTPTLMGKDYVTISDNGQPRMHVLVYRRDNGQLVCAEPVFQPGQASNENSLIATDKSIIVENNFGYKDPRKDTTHGRTTKPGIARVDLENGACHTVWTNESVSIPSVVSKMSLANGLIYTYAKPKGPATTDPWYFTAIDFHTGETVWKQLAGTGVLYNNHYAAAYLGPDGTLYVGVLGGIAAMRDGK